MHTHTHAHIHTYAASHLLTYIHTWWHYTPSKPSRIVAESRVFDFHSCHGNGTAAAHNRTYAAKIRSNYMRSLTYTASFLALLWSNAYRRATTQHSRIPLCVNWRMTPSIDMNGAYVRRGACHSEKTPFRCGYVSAKVQCTNERTTVVVPVRNVKSNLMHWRPEDDRCNVQLSQGHG